MKTLLKWTMVIGLIWAVWSCQNTKRPEWADLNDKVIQENDVKSRIRTDIQESNIESNIKVGEKINYKNLPATRLSDGVTAKIFWGKGGLMSFVSLKPNSSIPDKTIEGERFLFVLEGSVKELIKGEYANLKATPGDSPGAVLSATPVSEFVYLEDGDKTAIKAGDKGAEILEIYSPAAIDYLKKAGYKDIPDPISIDKYPVEPNVEPQKIYNLYDFVTIQVYKHLVKQPYLSLFDDLQNIPEGEK